MLTKFGIWEIDEEFGLVGKVNPGYDYNIAKERLWETTEYRGQLVWEWLIHLTEKTWITVDNYNDLVAAFLFGQDFFKNSRPTNARQASTAQTIYVGQQLVEVGSKSENDNEMGTDVTSKDSMDKMMKYLEELSEIKLLGNV